jgi:hypothetical protein
MRAASAADPPRQARGIVVGGFARGEYQTCHALVPALRDQQLRAAPIVEDERHTLELEPLQELDQEANLASQREVGIRIHRSTVGTHRHGRTDAANVARQLLYDSVPERAVHQQPVQQNDHGPRSGPVLVADRSRRQLDLGHRGVRAGR